MEAGWTEKRSIQQQAAAAAEAAAAASSTAEQSSAAAPRVRKKRRRDEENGYLGYLRAGGESGKVQSRGKENKKENRGSCRVLLSFGASTRSGWGWRGGKVEEEESRRL